MTETKCKYIDATKSLGILEFQLTPKNYDFVMEILKDFDKDKNKALVKICKIERERQWFIHLSQDLGNECDKVIAHAMEELEKRMKNDW